MCSKRSGAAGSTSNTRMDAPLRDTINCGGCEKPISELIETLPLLLLSGSGRAAHFRIIKFQTISITNFGRNFICSAGDRQIDVGTQTDIKREREKERQAVCSGWIELN